MTAVAERAQERGSKQRPAATVLGRGLPQVNLLPESVRSVQRLREVRGWFGLAVLVAVVLVAGGWLVGMLVVNGAQDDLTAEQARTDALITEKGQYAEVTPVLAEVQRMGAAMVVASGGEVLWADYLGAVAGVLPPEVALKTVATASAGSDGASQVDPLVTPGVVQLTFTGESSSPVDVAALLDSLEGVRGFDDARVSVVQRNDASGYDVTGTVQVTTSAFSLRLMGALP
jgi:Tfp pilus assembly protein PilN